MVDKEKIICPKCKNKDIIKKGKRKTKLTLKQIYKCKNCGKRFTLEQLKNKTYPARIVLKAVSNYNLGYSLEKTSKLVNKTYKIKISPKTIHPWLKEFNNICTYYRIRKKSMLLFKPDEIILKKVFYHQQPYKFQLHKAKIRFFINEYFSGLRNYLKNVVKGCPNNLFKESSRGSSIKLGIDLSKINIVKRKNYACKLAKLALQITNNNRKRHDILQSFLLINDTATIATEVPVYLLPNEIKYYKFIDKSSCDSKSKNKDNKAITGHIDFIQMRFGNIHLLDYKPTADKENAIAQLFVYTLALSKRTNIFLRNFRCAWFDENAYFEFNPNEIILAFDKKIPKWKLKEFLSDDKARRYYTSKTFQKIRTDKTPNKKILKAGSRISDKQFTNQVLDLRRGFTNQVLDLRRGLGLRFQKCNFDLKGKSGLIRMQSL